MHQEMPQRRPEAGGYPRPRGIPARLSGADDPIAPDLKPTKNTFSFSSCSSCRLFCLLPPSSSTSSSLSFLPFLCCCFLYVGLAAEGLGTSVGYFFLACPPREILYQGGETPKALSSRVLVAAYWLFVVLMLATFTANVKSQYIIQSSIEGGGSIQSRIEIVFQTNN